MRRDGRTIDVQRAALCVLCHNSGVRWPQPSRRRPAAGEADERLVPNANIEKPPIGCGDDQGKRPGTRGGTFCHRLLCTNAGKRYITVRLPTSDIPNRPPKYLTPSPFQESLPHHPTKSFRRASAHTHTHHTHTPEQDPETAHPEIAPFRNASCAGVAVRREQPWVYGGRGRGGSPPIELTLQWSLTLDRIFRLSWRMWRTREPV